MLEYRFYFVVPKHHLDYYHQCIKPAAAGIEVLLLLVPLVLRKGDDGDLHLCLARHLRHPPLICGSRFQEQVRVLALLSRL